MLNSATDKHAEGLGNASGLIGHFMMTHMSAWTWALFDEDIKNHMGTIAVQYMSYQQYPKTSHARHVRAIHYDGGLCTETTILPAKRGDLFGQELAGYMKPPRAISRA